MQCWLQSTVWLKGLLIPMLEKRNLFRWIGLIPLLLLMWKWMGLFLRKNHLLRCWGRLSLLNWVRAHTLFQFEPWFVLWSFFLLRLLYVSINLPYGHVWITVVMSGLVLLVPTWNCLIHYKNGYAWLLVLHLLPLSNSWLILKM